MPAWVVKVLVKARPLGFPAVSSPVCSTVTVYSASEGSKASGMKLKTEGPPTTLPSTFPLGPERRRLVPSTVGMLMYSLNWIEIEALVATELLVSDGLILITNGAVVSARRTPVEKVVLE